MTGRIIIILFVSQIGQRSNETKMKKVDRRVGWRKRKREREEG